jgi:hypothetical protein
LEFLQGAYLEVVFPALLLIRTDAGCQLEKAAGTNVVLLECLWVRWSERDECGKTHQITCCLHGMVRSEKLAIESLINATFAFMQIYM